MKAQHFGPQHVPQLDAVAGPALDGFVMDPHNAGLQLALAHRLRKFLAQAGFPAHQQVRRDHVGRLLNLAGVPSGMTKQVGHDVLDFLNHSRNALAGWGSQPASGSAAAAA